MRYLIVSDLHANWQALEAVLADARGRYDQILCCGDLVGYGADPNRMVEWARSSVHAVIRGNHDRACAAADSLEWFSPIARTSALWTRHALTPGNRQWLRALPQGPVDLPGFQLVHGSPRDEDEYLTSAAEFDAAFRAMSARVVFYGHTHLQSAISQLHTRISSWDSESTLDLGGRALWLINPGAVGQPRDGDPRAAWALFDSATNQVQLRRTPYDIEAARAVILGAGLPARLGNRLRKGE